MELNFYSLRKALRRLYSCLISYIFKKSSHASPFPRNALITGQRCSHESPGASSTSWTTRARAPRGRAAATRSWCRGWPPCPGWGGVRRCPACGAPPTTTPTPWGAPRASPASRASRCHSILFAIHLAFGDLHCLLPNYFCLLKLFFGDPNYFSPFQISNRVTEFHYSDSEAVDADAGDYHDNINEGHDDKSDSRADHGSHSPDDRLDLPPPVYPTINKKNKKNTFTKDQIIDLYCASTQDLR